MICDFILDFLLSGHKKVILILLIPLGQKKPFNRSASVGNHVLRGPKTTQEDGDKAANHGRKRNSSSEQQTPIGGDFLSNPSAALQRLFTCDRAMVADILQVCIFKVSVFYCLMKKFKSLNFYQKIFFTYFDQS